MMLRFALLAVGVLFSPLVAVESEDVMPLKVETYLENPKGRFTISAITPKLKLPLLKPAIISHPIPPGKITM